MFHVQKKSLNMVFSVRAASTDIFSSTDAIFKIHFDFTWLFYADNTILLDSTVGFEVYM